MAHKIDDELCSELSNLMIATAHHLGKVHELATKYFDSIVTSFPLLLCNRKLLFLLLEVIELVWQSCEAEYANEVCNER
jgi:phosphatidylinositol 4-kinase